MDRGFRDAVGDLKAKGFEVYIPTFSAGREQLPWQEANRNRLVTKNRWVVEAVNGRLKTRFRAMHHILQNTNIESKLMELKICCAIINKYGTRFISDKDHTDTIVSRIISRLEIPHQLFNMIEGNGLFRKRLGFRTFDPDREKILDQHLLQLYLTATGSYLVKYIDAYEAACLEARLEQRVR